MFAQNPYLSLTQETIAEFCQRHHISQMALFGSVLRDDFKGSSDIDVLVEFLPGHTPDFFRFVDMQDELGEVLERQVDLHTPRSLSEFFRDEVLASAQVIYEQA